MCPKSVYWGIRPSFPDWGLNLSIMNTLLIVNFSVDYQVVVEDQFRSLYSTECFTLLTPKLNSY